jgi:RecA/RadA recombinase
MAFDLYKAIMSDKGSKKKNTENDPLSSYIFNEDNQEELGFYSTNVISLNLLFAGRVDGAIPIGKVSMISAPPTLGKSIIAMSVIKGAQRINPDLVTILIDAEYSFDYNVAKKMKLDVSKEKLIVYQESSIEKVKNIILKTINLVPKEERKNILIVIDSWGTLVSSKTIDDGLAGKDVTDMTLPKKKNDLANILLNTRATAFVVNHVYMNTGGFGDPLQIPGGMRLIFNSSCIVLGTSRAKEKDDKKNLLGHIISAQTFKSRYSKEKTCLQFRMKHNGGLDPFYGILDDALEGGYVISGRVLDEKETKKKGEKVYKEKAGTYQRAHIEDDTPLKEEDIYNAKFWVPIFEQTDFKKYLEDKYQFRADFDIVTQEEDLNKIV